MGAIMKKHALTATPDQLGFDDLLADTDRVNEQAAFDRRYGHLPSTMEDAVPYFRAMLEKHHAAMLAADGPTATALREQAAELALRLNHGEPGILAGPEAPGCKLAILTAAPEGTVPIWGQVGRFQITVGKLLVRIDMDGVFGIGARFCPWMNVSATAVDRSKPFISETGYRSFMGLYAGLAPNMLPDNFAREMLAGYIKKELKGKLVAIDAKYAPSTNPD